MKVLQKLLPRAGIEMGMERLYRVMRELSGVREMVYIFIAVVA